MKPSFARRLAVSYLFVVAVTLLFTGLFLTRSLRQDFLRQLEGSLTAQATLLGDSFKSDFSAPDVAALQNRVAALGRTMAMRVTLIRPDGVVLADSERTLAEVRQMDNHLARPEVQAALASGAGESRRTSATLQKQMLYVAVPVRPNSREPLRGILRVALPTTEADRRVAAFQSDLLKAGAAALLVALLVALFSVHRISQPLRDLVSRAQEIGRGQFADHPQVRSADEFGRLATAFSDMAARIDEKVQEVSRERTQLSTILSALVESVVAIDGQGKVLLLNPAAERLFGVASSEARGRPFLETLRQSALNKILQESLKDKRAISSEITVHAPEERILLAELRPVSYGENDIGVLGALHDITELRRLERMRQEFVANASHELKTPLTSIKGYVETLLDGAIDDPKHNRDFLKIIQEQSHHLMRLIEDLLDLSAIEAKRVAYRFEPVAVDELVGRLFKGLEPLARARKVKLLSRLNSETPKVNADREKLAQILLNLIDNAVKFNQDGGDVEVQAHSRDESMLEISIRDTGTGIPPQDLPRVFERFYRADKSHSHDIPGTGLGLAIVKHLVEAHQGHATAESVPGQGSTFRITLPLA